MLGRSVRNGPHWEGRRAEASDARASEVREPPEESGEPRGGAEGNATQRHTPDTEPGKACHSSWIAYGEAATLLRRQTPEVGAVCGKSARTVLCGGRAVMRVPTAIAGCSCGPRLVPCTEDPLRSALTPNSDGSPSRFICMRQLRRRTAMAKVMAGRRLALPGHPLLPSLAVRSWTPTFRGHLGKWPPRVNVKGRLIGAACTGGSRPTTAVAGPNPSSKRDRNAQGEVHEPLKEKSHCPRQIPLAPGRAYRLYSY